MEIQKLLKLLLNLHKFWGECQKDGIYGGIVSILPPEIEKCSPFSIVEVRGGARVGLLNFPKLDYSVDVQLQFDSSIDVTMKDSPNIKIGKSLRFNWSPQGITEIVGFEVDLPGPVNPPIRSVSFGVDGITVSGPGFSKVLKTDSPSL